MMYCTEVMVEQHANISRMLKIIQAACCAILEGGEVDQKEFADIIDFIRNYADNHHHRREEEVLFPEMVDNLEEVASIIIKHGMLVEHDLVRAHVRALEEALSFTPKNRKRNTNSRFWRKLWLMPIACRCMLKKKTTSSIPWLTAACLKISKKKSTRRSKILKKKKTRPSYKVTWLYLDRLEKKYHIVA